MVHEFECQSLRSEILTARDRGYHFYVYVLSYADGTPFYVGKGKRWRLFVHEREARWHRSPRWNSGCSHVKSLLRRGHSVGYRIDCYTTTGESACDRETELIKEYGRVELGTGTLVNRTDGGDNPRNKRSTESLSAWHAANPAISLAISRKATAASQTPEALAKNARSQLDWIANNPALAEERKRRARIGRRKPAARRKTSQTKKRFFRENPNAAVEHSRKLKKWAAANHEHMQRMVAAAKTPQAIEKNKAACKAFWDANPTLKAAREAKRLAAFQSDEYRERRRLQVLEQARRRTEIKRQCESLCVEHGCNPPVLPPRAGVRMWERKLRELQELLNVTD